jgi:UDP-N-acetylglucosamine 4,6-dehydratase
MIGFDDAPFTYEYDKYYKILPAINSWDDDPSRISSGAKVAEDFSYSSDNNSEWMTVEDLQKWISQNKDLIGKI